MEEKPLMEKRNQYTYIKYNSIRPNRENIRMKKKKKRKENNYKKRPCSEPCANAVNCVQALNRTEFRCAVF